MVIDIKTQCQGRWASVLVALGVPEKTFTGLHQPCVFCGGRDRARWHPQKEFYICGQCGSKQAMDFAMGWLDQSFKDTAGEIRKIIGACDVVSHKPVDASTNENRLKIIHSGLKKISRDDAVGKYLLGRGIEVLPVNDVYFNPGVAYYDKDDDGKPVKVGVFPAMVSVFRNLNGETCTYHITYLTQDGKKIDQHPAKKILPVIREMKGGAVRLGGMGETLGIAEGVETALAAMQSSGIPCWAATSASLMENIQLPDSVRSVLIYTDEDKSFTGQKAAYTLANRLKVREDRTVNVVRLIGNKLDYHVDRGLDKDFCDYVFMGNGVLAMS